MHNLPSLIAVEIVVIGISALQGQKFYSYLSPKTIEGQLTWEGFTILDENSSLWDTKINIASNKDKLKDFIIRNEAKVKEINEITAYQLKITCSKIMNTKNEGPNMASARSFCANTR